MQETCHFKYFIFKSGYFLAFPEPSVGHLPELNGYLVLDSGRGAVASDTRGPWFESNSLVHKQPSVAITYLLLIFLKNLIKILCVG